MAIDNTPTQRLDEIHASQKAYFATGATLDLKFRRAALKKLLDTLQQHEKELSDALWTDLHKSYEEAYLTEFSIVYGEIRNHIKHLKCWAHAKHVKSPLSLFPSRSKVVVEPLGTALIIAPWNYPVQLLLNPLVGAISSGCTAVLKPSPYVPHVSQAIEQAIKEAFDEKYIAVVQGNRDVNTALLEQRYDLIFFTGSPALGKIVMAAAAKHLTPVVLELGGKSPCIVDAEANIDLAARRIAWGKLLNAGQTCIAPDYLLLNEQIKDKFIEALKREFTHLLGENPQESKHFVRIVSDKALQRLSSYLTDGEIILGGNYDAQERYFAPTLLDHVSPDARVMQEEIFGPIFPIMTFKQTQEAIDFVTAREKPLALYYFGSTSKADEVVRHTSAGGTCINDTIMHIANDHVPFGGVGNSGMSAYHGIDSFNVFSHRRAVITTPRALDLPVRYMPYKLFKYVKAIL